MLNTTLGLYEDGLKPISLQTEILIKLWDHIFFPISFKSFNNFGTTFHHKTESFNSIRTTFHKKSESFKDHVNTKKKKIFFRSFITQNQ